MADSFLLRGTSIIIVHCFFPDVFELNIEEGESNDAESVDALLSSVGLTERKVIPEPVPFQSADPLGTKTLLGTSLHKQSGCQSRLNNYSFLFVSFHFVSMLPCVVQINLWWIFIIKYDTIQKDVSLAGI